MTNHSPYQGFSKKLFLLIFALLLLVSIPQANAAGEEEEQTPPADISQDYVTYIRFHWKGALTSHSINLKVFPTQALLNDRTAFVAIYTKTSGTINAEGVQISKLTFDGSSHPKATTELKGLTPNTVYYYTFLFSTAGTLEASDFTTLAANPISKEFTFKTLGTALTPTSFTFGISCCAQTGSVNSVFNTLAKANNMDFFIYNGDMHYEDITTDDKSKFYDAYYRIFDNINQRDFFQNVPLVYVWDDDDFGGHDSNGNSPSKPAVTQVFREFVPTYPLKGAFPVDDASAEIPNAPQANNDRNDYQDYNEEGTDGIFRSFIIGRCLFIVMDLRSYKDLTSGDILGENQAKWLQNQLLFAKKNENIVQVFLVSTLPWINKAVTTDWSPYASTQGNIKTWVENYITGAGINKKIMLLGGHSSMVAFDDGSNNVHGGFPVVQAGSLDQNPSCQGGAYSHGMIQGRQQYAVISVTDSEGGNPCVQVKFGRNEELTATYDTCAPQNYSAKPASCKPSIIDQITDVIGGGSWTWFIIAMVFVALIVGVILYKAYQSYKSRKDTEAQHAEGEDYLEMTESSRKKKQNELL